MRKMIFAFSICLLCLSIFPYQVKQRSLVEVSTVINIEVPVRVFKGGEFVDGLKLRDFEIWEDGVQQTVEAVYLIKKDTIERKEEKKKKFKPQTERTFFLIFELSEYDPRVTKSVDYFVQNVLLQNDNLIAVTPVNTYKLKDKGLDIKPKEEIAKELKSYLRKDTIAGSGEYRSALEDLEDLAKVISAALSPTPHDQGRMLGQDPTANLMRDFGLELGLSMYISFLQKLEVLREVNQLRLMDFAEYLKKREGQNYVFLFYQREFIPQIDPKLIAASGSMYQGGGGGATGDITMLLKDATTQYRNVTVDIDRVKKAYADSATAVHFMYITRIPQNIPGVYFAERSSDVFSPFLEMAKASGGFYESSSNPDYLFKNALEASENYYMLYYAPKDYVGDGTFINIKVRVKGKGYKVVHRLGYFSN